MARIPTGNCGGLAVEQRTEKGREAMMFSRFAAVAALTLGGGANVDATGEVTSPPAPGTGLESTTESSAVTLGFPNEGGAVRGEVRVVYHVEFTEVFCEQEATFSFSLTGQFDALEGTMQGEAVEGGETVVLAGCSGLTTERSQTTTTWTATLDRSSGVITGQLAGGAPVDFVARADPAALESATSAATEPSATSPSVAPTTTATPRDDGGSGTSPWPFVGGGLLTLALGVAIFRFWPHPPMTLAEVHQFLGRARVGAETIDPADAKQWKAEVVAPLVEAARRLPAVAAPIRDDIERVRNEAQQGTRRRHTSLSEESGLGGSGSGTTDSYSPPPFFVNDVAAVQQQVELTPGFQEVIL